LSPPRLPNFARRAGKTGHLNHALAILTSAAARHRVPDGFCAEKDHTSMLKPTLAGLLLVVTTVTAASALTITNKSAKDITISVDEGEKSTVVEIAAGKTATFKDECKYGCAVGGPWNFSWFAKLGDNIETDGTCLTCVSEKK
jgi:hypothetical protein